MLGLQLLLAFAITAFGLAVAIRIKQMQSFMGVMQMIVMPLYFISGALFPATGLPGWLTVLNRIDPLAYAVDPMRRLVFSKLNISPIARHALDPGRPGGAGVCRRCSRRASCSPSGCCCWASRSGSSQHDRVGIRLGPGPEFARATHYCAPNGLCA